MMRNRCLFATAIVVAMMFSGVAPAGVIITPTSAPTVGLPGFTTYTLAASTDDGGQIFGFDFASLPTYGFWGPMNQVNPVGLPTIFQDVNAFFPFLGADVSQDSQFKFNSSSMVVPPGFASESPTSLRAVFASAGWLGTTNVPFVQIASNYGWKCFGSVVVNSGNEYRDIPVQAECLDCGLPYVIDAFIDNVDANNPGFVDHYFNALNAGTFSNLRFDSYVPAQGVSGAGPVVPATLGPGSLFRWNTVGSPLGTYKWLVTATGYFGSDDGSITVRITVPEPGVLSLVGLACAAQVAFARRRRVPLLACPAVCLLPTACTGLRQQAIHRERTPSGRPFEHC